MITRDSLLKIFNLSPVPAVILLPDAPDFSLIEANNSFLEIIKSSKEEIKGKDINSLFPISKYFQNEKPVLIAALQKLIKTTKSQKVSIGDIEYIEMSPIISDNGEIDFIVLYYFDGDINDFNGYNKKCLKEKDSLKISFENYEKVFQLSPIAEMIYELETLQILDVNESALKIYGYSREEFLNRSLTEIINSDQISLFKASERIEDNGDLIHFGIFKQLKQDKRIVYDEIFGKRFSFHEKNCMMLVCIDVTERENAMVQLGDFRKRLVTDQHLAKIGYWKRDILQNILFWSNTVYTILGFDKQTTEANFDLFYDRIFPGDKETFTQARSLALAGNALLDTEIRIIMPDGSIRWVSCTAKLNKDENGKSANFEGTLQDITEEKLLKISLEESNQRFDYVTRATFDAIWDWDLINNKSYWGDGFARTFGYDLNLINSDPEFWNHRIHPDDFEAVMKLINQSIHGEGANWTIEYRFQKANGEYAYIIDKCIIIRDKNAKATRLVGAMRDITEKKNLQQLLDKANRLAKIGSWEIDVASSTVYWSDITKEIRETGPDYEPTLNDGIGYFKKGFSRDTIVSRVKDSMQNGTSWQEDLQIYTHTGKLKWVRTNGKAELVDGKCVKIYGSFQDIDESKKAALEIKNLYEEKNEILESIEDGFFAVDKNWRVNYWNKEAEKMLGISKQVILGKNLWDIFPDQVNSHSFKKYTEAIKSNKRLFFEDYYASLDKWFEISAYPSKLGLSVYFKDISERIASLKELNNLNLNLQKTAQDLAISNAELEQFAYIASHDLQEPLRMITNFLTQLEKKYKDILDEKGKQYIYFAVDGAKRMRQIILDLLEFSKVGRFNEQKEKIDLNGVMEEVISLYKNQIEESGAVIKFKDLPIVNAYKSPVRQVIQNLISNAIKYRSEDEIPFIEIEAGEKEYYWEFFVKDNGIGIEPDYYERVFDIFQRLHKKEEYSGTGIGLAIVKKIITALGGEIRIEPNSKRGSIFIFTIPKS
ncbi:MAG: PAS domain-containing protein [Ginsengibacter sp.]